MGTVPSKGYNPNILDVNDPRFTALSNHPDRWLMANMIGEGDVYYGRGFEQVYCLNTAKANIAINDFVALGNRCGRVIGRTTSGSSTSDGKVTSITVYEDMRYLPLDYRDASAAYGYDDDDSKVGRTTVYVFGRDTELEGIPNGSNVVLFQGSMMVLRAQTNDQNTWNTIAQMAMQLQNNFDSLIDKENPSFFVLGLSSSPTKTTVSLAWTESTDNIGVETYKVYQDDVLVGEIPGGGLRTSVITGLTAATTYFFHVIAEDGNGNTTSSNVIQVQTEEAYITPQK